MEYFQSVTHQVINKYFCTPKSTCRPSPHRIPYMPFDLCNDYYGGVNGYNDLICCHRSDFKETPDSSWTTSFKFVPSFKSYTSKFALYNEYVTVKMLVIYGILRYSQFLNSYMLVARFMAEWIQRKTSIYR